MNHLQQERMKEIKDFIKRSVLSSVSINLKAIEETRGTTVSEVLSLGKGRVSHGHEHSYSRCRILLDGCIMM